MSNTAKTSTRPIKLAGFTAMAVVVALGAQAIIVSDAAQAQRFNPKKFVNDYTGITAVKNGIKPIGRLGNNKVRKPLRNLGKKLQKYGIGRN
ncbi:MAG: hypothetical protein AAFV45_13150 [Pseudomonadota bacterium]